MLISLMSHLKNLYSNEAPLLARWNEIKREIKAQLNEK